MSIIKANGDNLTFSDIVSVGLYKFKKYEILGSAEQNKRLGKNVYVVGHDDKKQPFEENSSIEPTETGIISDRAIFDSLLILASKALPISWKESNKLVLSWCETYGLPFCSTEASQQIGYFAFPLYQFYDFLFLLRDTFMKAESIHEDFSVEHGIDNVNIFAKNPYMRRSNHFTKEVKESFISGFINDTNLSLRFEYRNGIPTFYNYAPDIISLVRYQFALILLSNCESVPRRCKCCGSMFFASRKNKLYGSCCTRQKRYQKEKRRKEREEGLKNHG